MLKRFVLVICVLAVAACVEAPESSSTSPTGSDMGTSDLGGDDAEADAEPDLSGCECAPIIGQVVSSCEDECQYTCAEGFNQCPGDELICESADTQDDLDNGLDLNCDGIVGNPEGAVFLSKDGADTNDGLTPKTPVATFEKAREVLKGAGRARLLVGQGPYSTHLTIDEDLEVQGGWTIDNDGVWQSSEGAKTTFVGQNPSMPTMDIRLTESMQVSLSRLELIGPDASQGGQSVITLFIDGRDAIDDSSDQISFEGVSVKGGRAKDGAKGGNGIQGDVGRAGDEGLAAQDNSSTNAGGAGGVSPACNTGGPSVDGGKGGDASRRLDGGTGAQGSGPDGGEGGPGGSQPLVVSGDFQFGDRTNGDDGKMGSNGSGGDKANSPQEQPQILLNEQGMPVVESRLGDPGGDGSPGSGGGGGGAGGSTDSMTAPSGGGGGSGGCPGTGGRAGQPGGASIAILVVDANVDLSAVTVTFGVGGRGGDGGDGGVGGCGGSGGNGRESGSAGDAGDGGPGGAGGSGAGGNGGPGGPVVGVYSTEFSRIDEPSFIATNTARAEGGQRGASPLGDMECERERGEEAEDGPRGPIVEHGRFKL